MEVLWKWTLDSYARSSGDVDFVYFGPVSVWLSQVVTYVFCGLFFTFVDIYQCPAFVYKFKLQPKYAYDAKGNNRNPSLVKTLVIVTLAFMTEFVVLVGFQLLCNRYFGTGVHTTYAAPTWFDIFFAIVGLTLLSEIGFYWTHRLLHVVPWLYRNVHKYHHSFNTPIALAAEAQHPLEMALCTAFGMTFWPFALGTHAQVLIIGTVIGTFSSMHDHCGYWLYGSGIQPFFHDWHHEFVNGNFGFLGLMDWLCGTSVKWKATYEDRKKALLDKNKKME